MRRGLYRIRGIGGLPDEVRVDDDGIEVPMAEQAYSDRNYLPRVADLPWQEDYSKAPPVDVPDRQPVRSTVTGGLTLGDAGPAGRTSGRAFRDRLGPIRK